MDINLIKEKILEVIPNELSLYDVSYQKEGGNLILQVLLDKKDGITIEDLEGANKLISDMLDKYDSDMPLYYLEVSSPGAEKELRNYEEIKENVGKYIYLETNLVKYYGTLEEVNEDNLVIRVNFKGLFKNVNISLADLNFIRLAVKV